VTGGGLADPRQVADEAEQRAVQLADARRRPSWQRLVVQLGEVLRLRPDGDAADDDLTPYSAADETRPVTAAAAAYTAALQDAEHRARQLAGSVSPRGSRKTVRLDLARLILETASGEAAAAQTRQAQRGGRGPVRQTVPAAPTLDPDVARLSQEDRALVNTIARCIHRRYFLSDVEAGRTLIAGPLRQLVREAAREVGASDVPVPRSARLSVASGVVQDSLQAAYAGGLDVCSRLIAGDVRGATLLAERVQAHRLDYLQANAELERTRVTHHTGRYFHGDILSVRVQGDDGGMTQYYTRLTIVYAEDGHRVVVANRRELEALTGVRVGERGWASLCRWVEDLSDRAGGRKQGRRQDDDEHLVYRENEGDLRLRDSLDSYPDLLLAFECVRRALVLGMAAADVHVSEIPVRHPAEGYHPPQLVPEGAEAG
jgi:hypothetical protein